MAKHPTVIFKAQLPNQTDNSICRKCLNLKVSSAGKIKVCEEHKGAWQHAKNVLRRDKKREKKRQKVKLGLVGGQKIPRSKYLRYYNNYIKSKEWRQMRELILERAHNKCEECGVGGVPLQVHHKTYKRLRFEWMSDLVAVCRKCHENIHGLET